MKKQKSLAELSSRQLHTLHKKLWGWLAKTGSEWKSEWPGWEEIAIPTRGVLERTGNHRCFACCADLISKGRHPRCSHCPLCINGDETYNGCLNGLFSQWAFGSTISRKKAAAQIRDLPWDHSKVRKAKKCAR